MTKLTNKTAIEMALTFIPEEEIDLREKLEKIAEGFAKKSSAERKPTAKEQENTAIRTEILNFLRKNPSYGYTIADIKANVPALADATSQRVSGIMRPLILGALVSKYIEKRVTFFQAIIM